MKYNITFKHFFFLTFIFIITACKNNTRTQNLTTFGPLPFSDAYCPKENKTKLFKRFNKSQLSQYESCYDKSINSLHSKNLIIAKSHWLKHYQGIKASQDFLIESIDLLGLKKELLIELAHNYIITQNWSAAKEQIDLAGVEVNSKLRLLIEGHMGQFSEGTNHDLLPFIFRQKEIKNATIMRGQSNIFSLNRVSDGNVNTLNGEPSIVSSLDGENIWLAWTDSGIPTEISGSDFYWWRVKTAQSTNAGMTWSELDINPLPQSQFIERFHFDPMTAYDPANNTFYAGASLKGFNGVGGSSENTDSMYLFRWNLDNDELIGPTVISQNQPDKSWLTVDDNGVAYLAHHYGIEVSNDNGDSFSTIYNGVFFGAHPRIKDGDCLIVTDLEKTINCDNNEITLHDNNFSSIDLFLNSIDLVAGTFRVAPFVLNANHNNGDLFTIYTDLKSPNSDELTIYLTKSDNNGQTWDDPWRVTPDIKGDQYAPWIEIDENGGIHIMYFDTRHGSELDTDTSATLDVFYSYSADLGQTWQEIRVTPTSMTTPELIWGDYFLSDYLAMSVNNNQVYLAFPWSDVPDQMHMYFAKTTIDNIDNIFVNGFELDME